MVRVLDAEAMAGVAGIVRYRGEVDEGGEVIGLGLRRISEYPLRNAGKQEERRGEKQLDGEG